MAIAIPFAAGLLIGVGLAIKYFQNKAVTYAGLAVVGVIFASDLLLGFNPIKASSSAGILFTVFKTGRFDLR